MESGETGYTSRKETRFVKMKDYEQESDTVNNTPATEEREVTAGRIEQGRGDLMEDAGIHVRIVHIIPLLIHSFILLFIFNK